MQKTIKIFISGDFCPIRRIGDLVKNKNYSAIFNGIEKRIKATDFALVNLECPITPSGKKTKKTGPCLKTENENSLKALRYAGFDLVTLANNHIRDYSDQGVVDTLRLARKEEFDVVGAGENLEEASRPFIKTIKGIKIGFLNIAENEFCAATEKKAGAYTLNLIDNIKQMRRIKNQVDKLIVIYHGGREHYPLPTPGQRKRLRYFIEEGADAIVCHHTHCYSGFEYYQGKPIIYSLGNFIFDGKQKYQKGKWTKGVSVILKLKDDTFVPKFIPHLQGRQQDPTLHIAEGKVKQKMLSKIDELSRIIRDDKVFFESWKNYLKTQERFYLSSLYIRNNYFRQFFVRGFIPITILRNKHNRLLLNLMNCEAHHEISKAILKDE